MSRGRMFAQVVALVGATCVLIACSSSSSTSDSSSRSEDVGESFEKGSRFPELSLEGYIDKNGDGALTADEHGPLRPSEILKAYPAAELVLVHVAFEWCKYCWHETGDQIVMAKHYGGRFVSIQIMIETRDGDPAGRALLDTWTKVHKSPLPTVVEPGRRLFDRFGKSATYLLLDARDGLRVLEVGAGPPQFEVVRNEIGKRLGPLPGKTHSQ